MRFSKIFKTDAKRIFFFFFAKRFLRPCFTAYPCPLTDDALQYFIILCILIACGCQLCAVRIYYLRIRYPRLRPHWQWYTFHQTRKACGHTGSDFKVSRFQRCKTCLFFSFLVASVKQINNYSKKFSDAQRIICYDEFCVATIVAPTVLYWAQRKFEISAQYREHFLIGK